MKGRFTDISPDQIIQMAQRLGPVVRLVFFLPNGGSGVVFCSQEAKFRAETWNARGEKALAQIVRWHQGDFQLDVVPFDLVPQKRWHGDLPFVLHKLRIEQIPEDASAIRLVIGPAFVSCEPPRKCEGPTSKKPWKNCSISA